MESNGEHRGFQAGLDALSADYERTCLETPAAADSTYLQIGESCHLPVVKPGNGKYPI